MKFLEIITRGMLNESIIYAIIALILFGIVIFLY
jgi:hypothetical protein